MLRTMLILIALASLLLFAAGLGPGPAITWFAFTSGGNHFSTGIYTLDSAIGQPAVGTNFATAFELCAGFLCGINIGAKVYFPTVYR